MSPGRVGCPYPTVPTIQRLFFIMVRPEDEPYLWLNPHAFILRYGRLSEAS